MAQAIASATAIVKSTASVTAKYARALRGSGSRSVGGTPAGGDGSVTGTTDGGGASSVCTSAA